ncbi:succinate dehydrogenase, cytochrome b556 subunit [Alphaproteobacteria bacterium]|nr:succinate dehydrogenase, cytochrome b556 subunit [Alphaproteobacteria bacterium]
MIENRPLSPHLSIHKKVLTSVFSIFHRITGIGLSIGSILITLWVTLLGLGPKYFFIFEFLSSTILFKLVLFLWTVGIFYHLFNGIRYLFWTYGIGMELKTVYNSSYIVVILTILSTCLTWFLAL